MRETLLAVVGALVLAAAPALALEVAAKATLSWEAASGPVVGYYVIVSRNGAAPALEGVTDRTSSDIEGETGDSAVVQVAAFGADGAAGPLSEPSEPLHFVSDLGSGSGTGGSSDPDSGTAPGDGSGGGSDPGGSGGGLLRASHDFSCDGYSDLIVRGADGRYRIWELADGRLVGKIDLATASALDDLVGAGDYDGDGCSDLLWQDRDSGLLSVWTLDAGHFVSRQVLEQTALPTDEAWRVGGSGDLDGDGVDDLLLYSVSMGEIEMWRMRDGAVASTARLAGRTGSWAVPALIDSDGDGAFEALWYEATSRNLEHLDPRSGVETGLWKVHNHWSPLASADFDGDGIGEVFVFNAQRGSAATLEAHAGELGDVLRLPDASELGHAVGFGDYDGDGLDDIAWAEPDRGVVTLWLEAGRRQVELGELLDPGARVMEARGSID